MGSTPTERDRTLAAEPLTRINARLDEEHALKVEYLKRETGMSVSDLVKLGIDKLYLEIRAEPASALEILEKVGFIGSGEGPADLSLRYKEELGEILASKYGDR